MATERSDLLSLNDFSNGRFGFNSFARNSNQRSHRPFKSAGPLKHPPWKGNSFNPNHLYRYNYLDSEESNEKRSEKIIKNLDRYMKEIFYCENFQAFYNDFIQVVPIKINQQKQLLSI
jgi:hypothetical protein